MDELDASEATTSGLSAPSSYLAPPDVPGVPAHAAAFDVFYRDCVPKLVAFLRWQGVPLHDAADITQKTMMEAYQVWTTINKPHAWARRVSSRMWARRTAQVVEDPVAEIPERPLLLAVTDIVAWEQRHDVLHILDRLPARQRQVLAWTLDGYNPIEIAAELKMTPEAVRASLAKARRAVATCLGETGEQR